MRTVRESINPSMTPTVSFVVTRPAAVDEAFLRSV